MRLSCHLDSLFGEINVTWSRERKWTSRCKCIDKSLFFAISHAHINIFSVNIELRRCYTGAVFVVRQMWQLLVFSDKWRVFVVLSLLSLWFSSPAHPACIPGTFKSKFGEGSCAPCPSNSRTSARGANICPCQNGFYRADSDPPDSFCTSKSSCAQTKNKILQDFFCWVSFEKSEE